LISKNDPAVKLSVLLIALMGLSIGFSAVQVDAAASPLHFSHIVVIMQENHSFDNMFGTFPNLPSGYGLNLATCMPLSTSQKSATPCDKPWNADAKATTVQSQDISHTRPSALKAYDNGLMNGFVANAPSCCKTYTMAYYDGTELPYYWDYASYFTLNDLMMSSGLSNSLPNHIFAVAAQAGALGTCTKNCVPQYNLAFPQIGQSLTAAGLSWAYYQYNWNDAIDCTGPYTSSTQFSISGGYDGKWSGLVDFTQVQTTPVECSSLLNFKDLQNAIQDNNLPDVTWVIPSPSVSEHPGQGTWANGQQYVSSIINSIEASPDWPSTCIFLLWDDWGGYYDNIVPTQIDPAGEGFRVPLIAISPYSISGGIVHGPSYVANGKQTNQEDFSSILSTIESNWNIPSLGQRDSFEPPLWYMFNFVQTPLPPLFLASTGVVYPLSSCTAACTHVATAPLVFNSQTYTAPPYNNSETLNQSLAFSGNGDPDD
jgi:phospholipase C